MLNRIKHALWALALSAGAFPVGANAAPPPPQPDPGDAPDLPCPGVTWEALEHMPLPVFLAGISRSGRHAIVTGGITQTGITAAVAQRFDLHEMRWAAIGQDPEGPTRLPSGSRPARSTDRASDGERPEESAFIRLGRGRCMHAQVTLRDGRILIVGGQSGTAPGRLRPLASCELIDIEHHRAAAAPPLPRAVRQPTVHRLPDGRVLVVGGSTASILDPKGIRWVRHIRLREARDAHTSVLLPDETVLVIGGTRRRSLERVDPAGGISRLLPIRLPRETDDLRATVLPDGRVWVLGGQHSLGGDTMDRTWLIRLGADGESSIRDGPRLGIVRGVADHHVADLGRWCVVVGGESQRHGTDTELKTARLLDRRNPRIAPLPDTRWPHDDAAVLALDRGLIVFGGVLTHTMAHRSKRQTTIPIVVAAVERLLLPDERTLEAMFPRDPH